MLRKSRNSDWENTDRKHVLRNELTAGYLYDIYYIEKWGTGIAKMRRLMQEHGLEEPFFEDLGNFFAVTFYGPGERILDLIPELAWWTSGSWA